MSDPLDRRGGKVRKNLFRERALERYKGPLQSDVPDTLLPWRPGLVRAAGLVAAAILLLWLLP